MSFTIMPKTLQHYRYMQCPDVLTNIVGNNITNNTIKQIVTTKLPPPLLERYISFKKHLVFAIQVDVHKYQPLHIYARVI